MREGEEGLQKYDKVMVDGKVTWVPVKEHAWEKVARLAAADIDKVTHFVKDKITGKEEAITDEEYWKKTAALEAAKPPRKPNKPVVKDPVVKKYEYKNGDLTLRKVKQSVLIAEKKIAEKARLAAEAVSSAKIVERNREVREAIALRKIEVARLAEKKRLGTSWLPEKNAAVKAIIKADVAKYGYGAKPIPKPKAILYEITDRFPLKPVVVGMVAIGAAMLYFMRRKK